MEIRIEFRTTDDGESAPSAVRFGARRVAVRAVLDRWYGRHDTWWKLDTDDGPCILRHAHATDEWTLAAVPYARGPTPAAVPRPPGANRLH